jgi:gluconate:H+ symporter, GntP family
MNAQPAFWGGPLGILALSVAFIVLAIGVFRLPAFVALMTAAAMVGLLSTLGGTGNDRFLRVIQSVMTEAGVAMSRVAFPIAMAASIGLCLSESGAADKIVRRSIAVLGEPRAAAALLLCSFVLAAPVFIDTVMMLMLPLARALSLRTGRHYLLYVLVICGGAAISNGIIPPAPGPLFVATTLKLDLGRTILAGGLFGIMPLAGSWLLARWFNSRSHVPVRPTPGSTLESLRFAMARPESELPGFAGSIAPILIPMLLIALASFVSVIRGGVSARTSMLIEFLGDKNVALLIGAAIAVAVNAHQMKLGWRSAAKILHPPLEVAGVIILVISAGGAYGAMIKASGVGEAVRQLAGSHPINYVVLAWATAAILRAAQGSATVATITAVGIMVSVAGPAGFGVHPLYILLAVGFGSKFLDWMNDSGFWVVCRIGGLTPGETLRSWTIVVSLVSILGLIEVWAVSSCFPQLPF